MAPQHDDQSLSPEAEVAASLVGMMLADRYRVERVIGIGGVGTVFRATQVGLERRVAIKVLRPELTQNPNAMVRFAREARTAAALQHPNIVTVHDFGTTVEGRAYLVMEFIKGMNLAQWIRRTHPPDAAAAAGFLVEVCSAVDALHDSGIIHRDIKPSNIMIAEGKGGRPVVKVVDFGLVRPNLGDDATDLTGGLVLGTPEFMAPELFTGTRPDARTDIYALGVTAYEAFTGELPFGTANFREMYTRHTQWTPVRPSEKSSELPAGVDELVFRALNKQPNGRYATAAELGESISATFGGASPARPRPSAPAPPPEHPTEKGVAHDELVTRIGSILVVEDDRAVRTRIVEGLRRYGFEVTDAGDGIEAFLLLGRSTFDAIVSDVAMPNLDGMALLRLLSEKGIRTPVILLTGTLNEHDERLGLQLGAASIVLKPVDVERLAAELRTVLGYLDTTHNGPAQ
jgi:eukaryotic-like serine/threonine-protein kinase